MTSTLIIYFLEMTSNSIIIILIIISSLFAIPLYTKQKGNNSNFLKVISKWSEVILFLLFIIPSYWLIQFFLAVLLTTFISNWNRLYDKFYVIITIICLILAVFTTWLLSKVYSLLKSKIKVCDWKYNLICFMELFSLRNILFFIITTTYFIWLIFLWINMGVLLALGWWAN